MRRGYQLSSISSDADEGEEPWKVQPREGAAEERDGAEEAKELAATCLRVV